MNNNATGPKDTWTLQLTSCAVNTDQSTGNKWFMQFTAFKEGFFFFCFFFSRDRTPAISSIGIMDHCEAHI